LCLWITTGQVAPTAKKGYKSKSTPSGIIEESVNPLALAISQEQLLLHSLLQWRINNYKINQSRIEHKGFSLVNILQPCVTFNKINTYQYYMNHIYKLPSDYKTDNKEEAIKKALELDQEKFPIEFYITLINFHTLNNLFQLRRMH